MAPKADPARPLNKPQRQHRIARLLAEHAVTSQAHLVELLAADGVTATQATVSRDLEDLGAIKVRVAGGETAYAIPELPSSQRAPEDHLRRVFGDWVVEVGYSLNLVVLRTPPGSAHVVGSALDRAGQVVDMEAHEPATRRRPRRGRETSVPLPLRRERRETSPVSRRTKTARADPSRRSSPAGCTTSTRWTRTKKTNRSTRCRTS